MSKKIKIDFYKITLPGTSQLAFEVLLQKAIQVHEVDRTKTIRGVPIRLHSLQDNQFNNHQVWEGEIIRIRMSDTPVIADLKGGIKDINLNDDQGIGEQTAFLYHPKNRVLLIHNTQSGVSLPVLLQYFREFADFDEQIYGDAVIQLDTMQRFDSIQIFRRFEVRVAGLDNTGIFENQGRSLGEITRIADDFNAPVMNINMSTGHKKTESLNPNIIKGAIDSLRGAFGNRRQQISKIRVSGATDDGDLVVLDFVKDRMVEVIEVNNPKRERKVPYSTRQNAILDAFKHRQDELIKMYCLPQINQGI